MLDLGSGTGILGLIGARAGMERVYSVDAGPIIGAAEQVARHGPYAERFSFLRGFSGDVGLPERVDLVVCDQIGGFVHDAGVLEYFADAKRRFLAPGGSLVPARFRLRVAPAECGEVRDHISLWSSRPAGFDFSVFADLAVNTEHRVDPAALRVIGSAVDIADISSDHVAPIRGSGVSEVMEPGRCDGLVGWFEADLWPGISITNAPGDPGRISRWCNFYPLAQGWAVAPGDRAACNVEVRPLLPSVRWRVTMPRRDGTQRSEQHCTLLGEFLSADDLSGQLVGRVERTRLGDALMRALELADGTKPMSQILDLVDPPPASPNSVDLGRRRIREALERFTSVSCSPDDGGA